jgi:hypothetical protein
MFNMIYNIKTTTPSRESTGLELEADDLLGFDLEFYEQVLLGRLIMMKLI